jgi:hypothetical protein
MRRLKTSRHKVVFPISYTWKPRLSDGEVELLLEVLSNSDLFVGLAIFTLQEEFLGLRVFGESHE